MTSRKTSAHFTSRAHEAPTPQPAQDLYPRSTPIFCDVFRAIFMRFLAPRGQDGQPIPPFYEVENRNDWNPLTLHFRWSERGLFKADLQNAIVPYLKSAAELAGPGTEILLSDTGGSMSFTHPDAALGLLERMIIHSSGMTTTTTGICGRNPLNDDPDLPDGIMARVKASYTEAVAGSDPTLTPHHLMYLPPRPYASQQDALATMRIFDELVKGEKFIVNLDRFANEVAADCGRMLPHPIAALH